MPSRRGSGFWREVMSGCSADERSSWRPLTYALGRGTRSPGHRVVGRVYRESPPEGRDALRDTADIVLDLSGGDGTSAPCAQARLAVWWPEGVPVRVGGVHADLPEVVTSVLRGSSVVGFTLYARLPGRSETAVLDRAICPDAPEFALVDGRVPGGLCPSADRGETDERESRVSAARRLPGSRESPADRA